jgi:hypothetical protein
MARRSPCMPLFPLLLALSLAPPAETLGGRGAGHQPARQARWQDGERWGPERDRSQPSFAGSRRGSHPWGRLPTPSPRLEGP